MRLSFLYFLLLISCTVGALDLNEEAEISLLTCSPGEEVYTSFGHSAIRVYDPIHRMDKVYNYGTFSFREPNFYPKFLRGKLPYKLGVSKFDRFAAVYKYEERSIVEQQLNLSKAEKQRLYDLLEENYRPGNRKYMYDFFYDNCSSRIRDIVRDATDGRLQFVAADQSAISFRSLLDDYIGFQPWVDYGIDLILGLPSDKTAGIDGRMFLPNELMYAFDRATLDGKPIVKLKKTIVSAPMEKNIQANILIPIVVFSVLLLLGLVLTYFNWKNQRKGRVFDVLLFGLMGLVGLILFLFWTATDHQACYANMNMLWALPTHLIATLFLMKSNRPKWLKIYFLFSAILLLITLITFPVLPQALHYASIPLIILLLVRSVFIWRLSDSVKLQH